jgi:hypothetical protein
MTTLEKHLTELKALGYNRDTLTRLRIIENRAHRFAERVCNEDVSDIEQDRHDTAVINAIARLFNGTLPPGFFINGDPRGYALKIEQPNDKRVISFTDWGGYGILAPDLKDLK